MCSNRVRFSGGDFIALSIHDFSNRQNENLIILKISFPKLARSCHGRGLMTPIDFPETNTIILSENQPAYAPLPALYIGDSRGTCIACLEISEEELAEIVTTRKIWVTVLTFQQPFQPFMLSTEKPVLEGVLSDTNQTTLNFEPI